MKDSPAGLLMLAASNPHVSALGFEDAVSCFEKQMVITALNRNGWDIVRTAEALQMSKRHLEFVIQNHKIKTPDTAVKKPVSSVQRPNLKIPIRR